MQLFAIVNAHYFLVVALKLRQISLHFHPCPLAVAPVGVQYSRKLFLLFFGELILVCLYFRECLGRHKVNVIPTVYNFLVNLRRSFGVLMTLRWLLFLLSYCQGPEMVIGMNTQGALVLCFACLKQFVTKFLIQVLSAQIAVKLVG